MEQRRGELKKKGENATIGLYQKMNTHLRNEYILFYIENH